MGKRSDTDSSKKGKEDRRRKNVESAIRSRDRLKNEQHWMSIQMQENEDRMRNLEKKVVELTEELVGSKSRSSKKARPYVPDDRPKWFGEPF